jgi:hypothetical protein
VRDIAEIARACTTVLTKDGLHRPSHPRNAPGLNRHRPAPPPPAYTTATGIGYVDLLGW